MTAMTNTNPTTAPTTIHFQAAEPLRRCGGDVASMWSVVPDIQKRISHHY
jgi:hypothetical protein